MRKIKEFKNIKPEEGCNFTAGEIVEVSDNGWNWKLAYFSHIDEKYEKKYYCWSNYFSASRREYPGESDWKYCRKYGTLWKEVYGEGVMEETNFTPGELVEVSDGDGNWRLRCYVGVEEEFSYGKGLYVTTTLDGKHQSRAWWKYCRKYGSLGEEMYGD